MVDFGTDFPEGAAATLTVIPHSAMDSDSKDAVYDNTGDILNEAAMRIRSILSEMGLFAKIEVYLDSERIPY